MTYIERTEKEHDTVQYEPRRVTLFSCPADELFDPHGAFEDDLGYRDRIEWISRPVP